MNIFPNGNNFYSLRRRINHHMYILFLLNVKFPLQILALTTSQHIQKCLVPNGILGTKYNYMRMLEDSGQMNVYLENFTLSNGCLPCVDE